MKKKLFLTDDKIKYAYAHGASASAIARLCGCTATTIINRLMDMDVKIRRQTNGLCFIIYQHHIDHKDDSESFSTDYMLKMSQPIIRAKR